MKSKFFMPLVAAMLFASCSSDEPVAIPGDSDDVAGAKYLTVNLVSTPDNAGSKAEGDQTPGEPGDAIYEEGYASENKVNAVRFYFFDNDGNIAAVKANGANYLDWTPVQEDGGNNMPNVEKILSPTIVISTKAGDRLPTRIVAVINPVTEALGEGNLDLTTLRNRTKDYVAAATGTDGAFVMINSVYSQNGEIAATAVSNDNYSSTEDGAKANPVNIYVERCVAKVRVTLGTGVEKTASGLIVLKDKNGNPITVEGKQVYLKTSTWNVTAETDKGYLSKHIDASWASDLFGNEAWNYYPFFRSFWAKNPADVKQNWHNFDDIAAKGGKNYTGDLDNSIYINENADQTLGITAESTGADVEPFTKVLIAGELVDAEGNAIEVCQYAGAKIIDKANLKKLLLQNLANNGMIYSYETTGTETGGTETTYTALAEADVEFVSALDSEFEGKPDDFETEATQGRYRVYLQLTSAGAAKNWSKSNAKEQPEGSRFANSTAVNEYLAKQCGPAQIHKGGLTYYYFPIRHLGESGKVGFYGVVRNHIYNCVINSIVGLGTPVYDPSEVIYPEKPENEETFIAAHINILSWRVVNNNVDLDW
jgi:hypothetical protein